MDIEAVPFSHTCFFNFLYLSNYDYFNIGYVRQVLNVIFKDWNHEINYNGAVNGFYAFYWMLVNFCFDFYCSEFRDEINQILWIKIM